MKKILIVVGVLTSCALATEKSQGGGVPCGILKLEKFIERSAKAIRDFETVRGGMRAAERWIADLLGGRNPTTSLRCHKPDETLRSVTRQIQDLKAPPLPDVKDSPYRTLVKNDSPKKNWVDDKDKIIAYNQDMRKQIAAMKKVEAELERVVREARPIQTAVETVSSSHKRLESKIDAAKKIEPLMRETFGCAWQDLERGLLVNLRELIGEAEKKQREFRDGRSTQERALREHTEFLTAGFRKHGITLPSDIR